MHPVRAGFQTMLSEGPVLLSGAVGTELLRRGVPTPLPLWSAAALENGDELRRIHRDYVRAGARIVTANTFRADRVTLAKAGMAERTRELNKRAVTLAREGVAKARPGRPVLVGGSIAPVADCYAPEDVPDDRTLVVEHGVKVGHLVAAGAALAVVETMNTIREAVAALGAANAGNLPALVAFVCGSDATLLSGEPVAEAVAAVEPLQPLAVLVNCCGVEDATDALAKLLATTSLPAGVYANGRGRPDDALGWAFAGGTSRRGYTRWAKQWLAMGARLIGGCCGTDPRYIKAVAKLL